MRYRGAAETGWRVNWGVAAAMARIEPSLWNSWTVRFDLDLDGLPLLVATAEVGRLDYAQRLAREFFRSVGVPWAKRRGGPYIYQRRNYHDHLAAAGARHA